MSFPPIETPKAENNNRPLNVRGRNARKVIDWRERLARDRRLAHQIHQCTQLMHPTKDDFWPTRERLLERSTANDNRYDTLWADPEVRTLLLRIAPRYVWWKTAEEAVAMPERLVRRVIDFGTYDDLRALEIALSERVMADALVTAQGGEISPKSWAYFHYRYGLTEPGSPVPPVPVRYIPGPSDPE